jgi:Xaa-Pro dipeptidase
VIARESFREHIGQIAAMSERALAVYAEVGRSRAGAAPAEEGIVFHAGTTARYPADDLAVPFRPLPHFARFAPVPGPDHLLLFRPGEPARLVLVAPPDYWEEPPGRPDHPFAEVLDVVEAPSVEASAILLGDVSGCAYVGASPHVARHLGIRPDAIEPPGLLAALDWYRAFKTPYELACIREANRVAARGHRAARAGFAARKSEREIHADYLAATGALEHETPYPNIVAWDDRTSILHYQRKRATEPSPGRTFLIDAGARVNGYASDVTRTYAHPGAHPVFRIALDRMEVLQQQLVASVAPGGSFVDLHARAVAGVAAILCELGVLRVGVEEACATGVVLPFLPHGLGHHLGLQVHDVGGQQVTREGERRPPPDEHPTLRTTRDLAVGHVVTIEPGLYFIPTLLERFRGGAREGAFEWALIDALTPCGGIRIEDDVHVTASGPENLTRPRVPGHLDERVAPA